MIERRIKRIQLRALMVDDELPTATAEGHAARTLVQELKGRSIDVVEASSAEDGMSVVVSDSAIHTLLVDWSLGSNGKREHERARELLAFVRARNDKIPIFLMAERGKAASIPVVAIGKIEDLFAGRGITQGLHTVSDEDGMNQVERQMAALDRGFIFTNLVDFDAQYGHRNDVAGYAANLERFDRRLAALLPNLRDDDLLVVTADHGNDPTTPSTDHAREYVPLLIAGPRVQAGRDLGTRRTFADLGQTLAEIFGVGPIAHGTSFLREITK